MMFDESWSEKENRVSQKPVCGPGSLAPRHCDHCECCGDQEEAGGALSSRYNISQTDEDTTGRDNILSAQIFGSHFQQLHSY